MDRPYGPEGRKFDGLSGRGLWWRLRRSLKKRGPHSLGRSPVVRFYHKRAPSINLEAPSTTLSGIAAVSRVDGIRLLCPPLTEPYVRFSRIRLLE